MAKLTKRTVDGALPRDKSYLLFDDDVRGFALRVQPSGEKMFVMRYRFGGADRKLRLGRYRDLTPEEARRLALKARVSLADGIDPSAARRKAIASPTMEQLAERFMREHVMIYCKPSTQGDYRHALKIVLTKLGRRRVAEVTRADMAEFHQSLVKRLYLANRAMATCSKMFNLAEVWGLRQDGSNPCRLIKKYREVSRIWPSIRVLPVSRMVSALMAARKLSNKILLASGSDKFRKTIGSSRSTGRANRPSRMKSLTFG